MINGVRVTSFIGERLIDQVDEKCKRLNVSRSYIIRWALSAWVKRYNQDPDYQRFLAKVFSDCAAASDDFWNEDNCE